MEPLEPERDIPGVMSRNIAVRASLADASAFEQMYRQYRDDIYKYCAARVGDSAAEDLTAETFSVAFGARQTFDVDRGSARSWLYGIATHRIQKERRREHRQWKAYGRVAAVRPPYVDPSAVVDSKLAVADALARLGRKGRDVVFLIEGVGLSYEEAAYALGVPIGTVRSRLSRARGQLIRQLEKGKDESDRE
jgi:RNA polymerase sigma factor (sigma-70 family)